MPNRWQLHWNILILADWWSEQRLIKIQSNHTHSPQLRNVHLYTEYVYLFSTTLILLTIIKCYFAQSFLLISHALCRCCWYKSGAVCSELMIVTSKCQHQGPASLVRKDQAVILADMNLNILIIISGRHIVVQCHGVRPA